MKVLGEFEGVRPLNEYVLQQKIAGCGLLFFVEHSGIEPLTF